MGETLLHVATAINNRSIVTAHSGVKYGSRYETKVVGFTLRPLWPQIHTEQENGWGPEKKVSAA